MKIGIIGLGMVGKEILLNIFQKIQAEEIYILDLNKEKSLAEIMDLQDTIPFQNNYALNKLTLVDDYSYLQKCDIVIINVSIPNKGLSNDRLSLLKDNAKLMRDIASYFKNISHPIKVIITSNPVDLMSQIFMEESGISAHQIIGTGTYLDTARLQFYLSEHYKISSSNIHALVLGEHGNSSCIPWSLVKISGLSVEDFSLLYGFEPIDKESALSYVRERGFHIFGGRGYTDHGIGSSVYNILSSMIKNEKKILPVSCLLTNQYSIGNIVLSLPCIIGSQGIENILTPPLTYEEEIELKKSAQILEQAYQSIKK